MLGSKMNRLFPLRRFLAPRPRVYALVGKAGTGKSFRARLVAERKGYELILDDGLLIRGGKVLCGISAKTEATRTAATKVSIFEDDRRCAEIRTALDRERPASLLILGISERMIERIVGRLGLPGPVETHFIEEIATEEEILTARRDRRTLGNHVIPVPILEVKRAPADRIALSIRDFLVRHQFIRARNGWMEQSVVNPAYGRKGVLSVTEGAMAQMVLHCVQECSREALVRKIQVHPGAGMVALEIRLSHPGTRDLPDILAGMQEYVSTRIESISGVRISRCDITLDDVRIGPPARPASAGALPPPARDAED